MLEIQGWIQGRGQEGQCPPFQNFLYQVIFTLYNMKIQGCLISFIIIQLYMHKIILQVQLSYGLPLYIALIPQSKALHC